MSILEGHLASMLCRGWWILLLRGVAAIAFGVLTFFQPGISLAALVLLFGAYALADGVLAVYTAIAGGRDAESRWLVLLGGLVGIAVGIMTFASPGLTALALQFYIAIWATGTGIVAIAAAIRLRKEIEGEWMLVLGGLASIFLGLLLMLRPAAGALALLATIATYAVIFGAILVILAFKVKGLADRLKQA